MKTKKKAMKTTPTKRKHRKHVSREYEFGRRARNSRLFQFARAFKPREVDMLAFLYDEGGQFRGTISQMNFWMGRPKIYESNAVQYAKGLEKKGWIEHEKTRGEETWGLTRKFVEKFAIGKSANKNKTNAQ